MEGVGSLWRRPVLHNSSVHHRQRLPTPLPKTCCCDRALFILHPGGVSVAMDGSSCYVSYHRRTAYSVRSTPYFRRTLRWPWQSPLLYFLRPAQTSSFSNLANSLGMPESRRPMGMKYRGPHTIVGLPKRLPCSFFASEPPSEQWHSRLQSRMH